MLSKSFVGERQFPMVLTHEGKTVPFKLDPENPMTMGPNASAELLFRIQTPTRRRHEKRTKENPRSQQLNTQKSAAEATATDSSMPTNSKTLKLQLSASAQPLEH